MIYNIKNRSSDTTESQKKRCFNAHAGGKRNLILQCIASKQVRCDF